MGSNYSMALSLQRTKDTRKICPRNGEILYGFVCPIFREVSRGNIWQGLTHRYMFCCWFNVINIGYIDVETKCYMYFCDTCARSI